MSGTLKDVGKHIGTYGDGHYEATVLDDGSVKVITKFDDPEKKVDLLSIYHMLRGID